MDATLKNLRKLLEMEIVAETSWTLNSAEIYALRGLFAEVGRLKLALHSAIELAEEGISYTPEYFVKKWDMQERLDALKGGK